MSNASLHRLDLSWNGLENEGVMAIGEMLSMNLGIKELNLISTRAGAQACLIVAEGLKVIFCLHPFIHNGGWKRISRKSISSSCDLYARPLQDSNIFQCS